VHSYAVKKVCLANANILLSPIDMFRDLESIKALATPTLKSAKASKKIVLLFKNQQTGRFSIC
jgi:hypothetical protein